MPPTPRGVLECFAARVEAARAPGAWWALTRALVGFEAGEAEAATATATKRTRRCVHWRRAVRRGGFDPSRHPR